ncbi:MAG: chorismate synthase [Krumholzibacteria bacterium]|nr:chorismate synthase [Candidatus Krumholzibacteria bacterium]
MSSTFGTLLRITTFGESHGGGVGVVVDGCPPRLALDEAAVQAQLDRRRPGQSRIATPRDEPDRVEILSGLQDGLTLGTPIAMLVRNRDQRPGDYGTLRDVPRPSHADYTYERKYGIRATSGGGRASARETIGRVAAGAVAEQWLRAAFGTEIVAWVQSVADVEAGPVAADVVDRAAVDATIVRCPDTAAAARMIAAVDAARHDRDSVGGVVACVCRGVPAGLGEPVFAKLEALLAQAMLSLPAVKGFEIGSGFAGTRLRGSAHNDPFVARGDGALGTATNRSGGVQGGISNGEPVVFRVAFKPPATIAREQRTADFTGLEVELAAPGRHDPCVVPRAVPIVEAMAALVLADCALMQAARRRP